MILKTTRLATLAAGFALLTGAAEAAVVSNAFTLNFGATSTSSNSPLTGAAGTATFSFSDVIGGVEIDIDIANTTGATTFGAGATESKLTGFGFDLLSGFTVFGNTTGTVLDTFIPDADFQPFGTLDVAFGDNEKFNGGNANGALPQSQSDSVSVVLTTSFDASAAASLFETEFFSNGLQAGLRFQQVNAGAESDKLVFVPEVDVAPVPLPAAAWLLLAGLGGLAAMGRRKA